ncbi:MAG: cytochrome C oxidase subunit IV family protein [Planctomycetaceae bacterium]|nr:cytochrome C oxidase subunit IV family protein [Planctomycetaceae bacterium]
MSDHGLHKVNYAMIFGALCVCTVISYALDSVPNSAILVTGVLAIAVAKALFVMTYFMHLKFEGKWKFIILMPTAILAVGLMFALAPDMAMHYYTSDVPQVRYGQSETGHAEHQDAPTSKSEESHH